MQRVPVTDKQGWLACITQAHADWREIVALIGDEVDLPGVSGNWSFREMTSHLNGWRQRTVERLEAAAHRREPVDFFPDGLTDETEAEVDRINDWMVERDRARRWEEILGDADDQYRRMAAATEALADADLLTPGRYPWLGDYPVCAVISYSNEHLDEHIAQARAWLDSRTS